MAKLPEYPGIDNDANGGMTAIGKLIRDAWVFGVLEESETCVGWNIGRIDVLRDKVNAEWDKYGCMVSRLPPELFEKHQIIHNKGMENARSAGWNIEQEMDDEQ